MEQGGKSHTLKWKHYQWNQSMRRFLSKVSLKFNILFKYGSLFYKSIKSHRTLCNMMLNVIINEHLLRDNNIIQLNLSQL